MSFIRTLWSILNDLFGMMFTFDLTNPFVYVTCLIIVSITTILFIKKILWRK